MHDGVCELHLSSGHWLPSSCRPIAAEPDNDITQRPNTAWRHSVATPGKRWIPSLNHWHLTVILHISIYASFTFFVGHKHKATNWRKTFNTLTHMSPRPSPTRTTVSNVQDMVNRAVEGSTVGRWRLLLMVEHLRKNSFELRCCSACRPASLPACLRVCVYVCMIVCMIMSVCICFFVRPWAMRKKGHLRWLCTPLCILCAPSFSVCWHFYSKQLSNISTNYMWPDQSPIISKCIFIKGREESSSMIWSDLI